MIELTSYIEVPPFPLYKYVSDLYDSDICAAIAEIFEYRKSNQLSTPIQPFLDKIHEDCYNKIKEPLFTEEMKQAITYEAARRFYNQSSSFTKQVAQAKLNEL